MANRLTSNTVAEVLGREATEPRRTHDANPDLDFFTRSDAGIQFFKNTRQ